MVAIHKGKIPDPIIRGRTDAPIGVQKEKESNEKGKRLRKEAVDALRKSSGKRSGSL